MSWFDWLRPKPPLAPAAPAAAKVPPVHAVGDATKPVVLDMGAATGPRGTKGVQSRAWRNRNPGNMRIRSTKLPVDHVAVDNAPGGPFGIYGSERDGWADLAARVIQLHDGGTKTVREIIAIWAPPMENNTNVYISGVAAKIGVSPDASINPRDRLTMRALADAIRRHEGLGSDPAWDVDQREAGFTLAGVRA